MIFVSVAFLICGAAYFGLDAFFEAGPTVRLGVVTAVISVIAIVYNNARQQSREIKARQFSDKRVAYQKFFDFMFEIFDAQREGAVIAEEQTIRRMREILKDLMIWGSAETINEYNSFMRKSVAPQSERSKAIFKHTEALMRSFRKDLGHDDRALEALGLTKLIVKAEEHDQLDA